MNILLKILPVILISIIFYLLIYSLYPKFQETIALVKKLNELQNKQKELNTIEKLIQNLNQNANLQQLLNQKDVLNVWLPEEAKIEELIYTLNIFYQNLGLVFSGANFDMPKDPKSFNPNLSPLKVINFTVPVKLTYDKISSSIDFFEKNTRLMQIKKVFLSAGGDASFQVESYYLPKSLDEK